MRLIQKMVIIIYAKGKAKDARDSAAGNVADSIARDAENS